MQILLAILVSISFSIIECHNLVLKTQTKLDHFVIAQQENSLHAYETVYQMFFDIDMDYHQLRSLIRRDMVQCKKAFKKSAQDFILKQKLSTLQSFYRYVTSCKILCKALYFHRYLQTKYHHAFCNQNIVDCLYDQPDLYGVAHAHRKCRTYFKQLSQDLIKVDLFEDLIHADYSELKAHNYVYKIELIKIRNHVYHHTMYKFETHCF